VEGVKLEVPLPRGWTAAAATCFDPDTESEKLGCTVQDGHARLSLPRIRVYKVVLIESR
jgi:hypothetical protein